MKTIVYIDGFNLFYAIKTHKPACYKWLDVGALCALMLKDHEISRIRYFTARISARPHDPEPTRRQQVYLRALRTIPNLEIHEGHFLTSKKWSAFADPPATGIPVIPGVIEPHKKTGALMAWVMKTEEKGSDVNIATYLLVDAFQREFEQAVIITNDSDLVEPIRVVRSKMCLDVGVLNPHRNPSVALQRVATFYQPIREGALRVSQFPDIIITPKGRITKPVTW